MNRKVRITFWSLSIALLLLRLAFLSTTMLIDDEAYYAMFARHLAWGYIDGGPVVGYLIRCFTLVGENAFTVRLPALTLMTILTVVLYRFGKEQFNEATGMAMSLGLTANILFHTNAIVMTPDVPLTFFMILAIVYYYKAYFVNEKYLYGAGALLGLAMLSKISALFPAIGIVLFPAFIKEKRYIYKSIHFYSSLLVAFLVFLPFIIWNIQNDFAFVRYQGSHVAKAGNFSDFISLWAGLALTVGPVYFYYAVLRPIWVARNLKSLPPKYLYFFTVTAVPLIYFIAQSLHSRMEMNWPAPIFFGGLFLFGIAVGEKWPFTRGRFRFQIIFSLFLIVLISAQAFWKVLPLKGKSDPTNRYFLYDSFPFELSGYLEDHPEYASYSILAKNYQIPSMVNFYVHPDSEALCIPVGYHKTLYSFLYPDEALIGKDFLFLTTGANLPKKVEPLFSTSVRLDTFQSYRSDQKVRNYSLWLVTGYKGLEP